MPSMTYLKLRDKTLLCFNVDLGIYKIKEPDFLPFQIRDGMINLDGNVINLRIKK